MPANFRGTEVPGKPYQCHSATLHLVTRGDITMQFWACHRLQLHID